MKIWSGFYLLAALLLCGCSSQTDGRSAARDADTTQSPVNSMNHADKVPVLQEDEWIGVYSSPSEIGGFTGTVLVIERGLSDELHYRESFYSDVVSLNSIEQDVLSGDCLTEGNRIYIPAAFGYYDDEKPHLFASIDRYTMVVVNGHVTLMRDDAYSAFETENKLYDYGILIRVSPTADEPLDFEKVEHKTIKILYDDQTKEWEDPFVNGPNER